MEFSAAISQLAEGAVINFEAMIHASECRSLKSSFDWHFRLSAMAFRDHGDLLPGLVDDILHPVADSPDQLLLVVSRQFDADAE